MSFDAHEEKIRKIFSGDTKFVIPRNQRKYIWDEKQWKELLSDITYIKKQRELGCKEISHFLGSFVLQESDSQYEIIDGQQRITTLLLILSAVCVRFNELGNTEEHGKTRQNLIGNIGLKSQYVRLNNPTLSNMTVVIEMASEYRENLIKKNIFDSNLLKRDNEWNRRVIKCFWFYYNYFSDNYSTSDELKIVREVILDMKVIHIASEDELDCYDIFEILNARGVDLEDSELLKNYIFKYAQPKYTLDRAKEVWTKIEDNMEKCNGNMEQFLSHFTTYRYYKPTKEEGVFRIIKTNTDKEYVKTLLDDILSASNIYVDFYLPEDASNKVLGRCLEYFKIVNHRQFRPLIMAIIENYKKEYYGEKQVNDIFLYLRNFSFAFTLVMGNNSNIIDTKIHSLSQEVYKIHSQETLTKIKQELEKYYPAYEEFERAFLNLGFSNKNKQYSNSNNRKRMKYILQEIEEYKQTTNELVCNIEECNIEHIMNDSVDNPIVTKTGNLLLLSEKINHNMGNEKFSEKKDKLSRSKLVTVKEFLKNYSNNDTWTEEMIVNRTKKIAKMAYDEVWKL